MSLVATDAKCFHLRPCYLQPYLVLIGVEHGLHPESTFRCRGTDQIHDCLIVDQRLPFPGQTDEREQSMLALRAKIAETILLA